MKSKMIENRHQIANHLVSMVVRHRGEVAASLDRAFAAHDGPLPNWTALQSLAENRVTRARLALVSADAEQQNAARHARRLRRVRDTATRRLHRALGSIRLLFDATYGHRQCQRLLGFGGSIPQRPVVVYEVADRARTRMKDPDLELPKPAVRAVRLDFERLADQIDADLEVLGRVLEELSETQVLLARTSERKHAAMHRFDHEVGPWSRLLEASYELAGHQILAAHVRPYGRHRGRPRK